MVNSNLLQEEIKRSGKTKSHLARQIGCTVQTFRRKCLNLSDFTNVQTDVLCKELNISDLVRKEQIFFA